MSFLGARNAISIGVAQHLSMGGQRFASQSLPALDLDFLAMTVAGVLDSRITYTRTGNASYFDSAGAMQTAGANVPRLTYNPVTLQPAGLWLEGAATNLLRNSATLSTQSVTVAATTYTLSFYGTGTVVGSGSASFTQAGSGTYPTRTTRTFTATSGTLTLTVTGTVEFAQLETGNQATSWVPTTGASATRGLDSAGMTGTNFSSWYNPASGTGVVDYTPTALQSGNLGRIYNISDGTISNSIEQFVSVTANVSTYLIFAGATTQATMNTALPVVGQTVRYAGAYATSNFAVVADGGTPVTRSTGNVPAGLNQIRFGNRPDNARPAFGIMRRFRYYPTRLPNADLQTLTTP